MSDSSTSVSAPIIAATRARQPVVVAEADLGGRHGVVLVDHRHRAQRQQRARGGARVEIAAALLGVVERQQHLRRRDAVARQRVGIGLGQADLPGRGGGLLSSSLQRAGWQAEMAAAERDGAGRDQDAPPGRRARQRGDVVGQRRQPVAAQLAARVVDQQRRADLDDRAAWRGWRGASLTASGASCRLRLRASPRARAARRRFDAARVSSVAARPRR